MHIQNLVKFCPFCHDIEQKPNSDTSRAITLVINMLKMAGTNPNQDLVHINAYTKFGRIMSICSPDIQQKQNSDKGHISITNLRKMTDNNPNLDLVNINAHTKFGQILSICSEDIEQKRNYEEQNDGQTDGQPIQYSPTFSKRGYNKNPLFV